MGAKDSKPSFISYEDAVKRVSDSELRRIREAFKRCAGANGTALSLEAFVHEVLCDGVPYEVAEWLYQGCGGTKRGIAFKELLCGLVVLTKGNIEEKIKFLWTLYTNNQGENGTYIYKRDFARTLHLENTSLPITGAQRSAEILLGLFGPGDKVTFDQFRSWLLIHKDATVLSKWLLSDLNVTHDLETPTFYQSLAGVTHLEERDIIELEKCFWSLRQSAPTGELDAASLAPLLSPPLPAAAVAGAFQAFDENRDGHVDFKELCCGLSAACRGPTTERLKFCFKMFDLDSDGVLNQKELRDMVDILCTVATEHVKNQGSRASTPDEVEPDVQEKGFDADAILANLRGKLVAVPKGRKPMFQLGSSGEEEMIVLTETEGSGDPETVLTLEDFLIWSVESAEGLVSPFLALLFETCHIVLGLRPQCKHHERNIVLGWLHRWSCRGYRVGQFWYLVDAEWWRAWSAHTRHPEPCARAPCPLRAVHARVDDALLAEESFTTDSTESMGSLVWRCETASLGSAGSSSGVGSAPRGLDTMMPPRPGPIDNSRLKANNNLNVRSLTGEGGHVRRDVPLVQHRDFELVPDALWRALAHWYSAPDPLPRQVIRPPNAEVELELYPLQLMLYRHVPTAHRPSTLSAGAGAGVSLYSAVPLAPAPPERQLAYTAAFSRLATVKQVIEFLCAVLGLAREDVRLWTLAASAVLLDDETPTLQELQLHERSRVLLELRNPDLTWPEEIGALSMSSGGGGSRATERRETLVAPNLPGATGLHNLGNTCYMNAALQSVWNTGPLTRYFNSGMHLYEVNTDNPLGTRGALALRYGELCKEVWSMRLRSVAPLRVRWCVSRHARALAGGGQHDAQELLAWLLDALHEDLNRAPPLLPDRPPHADSDGRPDQVVAREAWSAHTARNDSIMTDLFCGQLKSRVKCEVCATESVRFDAFNMLSLPLPMESYVRAQIRVILLDGSVPIKYGVRVNSEGTYFDLKKNLSELCGLPPESMIVVELNGALIGRVFEDTAKVSAASSTELYAYETPKDSSETEASEMAEQNTNGWCGDGDNGAAASAAWRGEVSVGGANTSSLCMPALFCFKRSRSEVLMSQSPPATFLRSHSVYTDSADARSNTLPKEMKKEGSASPTMSVRSLTMKGAGIPRARFTSPPAKEQGPLARVHYLVAVHRKQNRSDAYFLASQRSRPALFGVPLLVGVRAGMSGRDLYAGVWTQLARLLSARPPPPPAGTNNHAQDCDDSLGYEFPFTLRLVGRGRGAWCGACPWPAMCRGCALPTTTHPLVTHGPGEPVSSSAASETGSLDAAQPAAGADSPRAQAKRLAATRSTHSDDGTSVSNTLSSLDLHALGGGTRHGASRGCMLAIEWDPTALHLRYQSTRERTTVLHPSLNKEAAEAAKAIDLQSCLRAFTSPEQLEQRYHCSACKENQPATKTLQLWRAPPILIIHLKRFQYVNNKWIKSQKVVNFPFVDFDPTEYLASVPRETILRHQEMELRRRTSVLVDQPITESDSEDQEPRDTGTRVKVEEKRKRRSSIEGKRRERLESTSLRNTPVTDDNLEDFHRHQLLANQDPMDLKYRLYAVVSHSGQMSGGHYVAYARNPSGAWLCYNDSSCRELNPHPAPPIDPANAYLLFYERQGLDYEKYLPDIRGREPVIKDSEALDPDESDLKKMCVVS